MKLFLRIMGGCAVVVVAVLVLALCGSPNASSSLERKLEALDGVTEVKARHSSSGFPRTSFYTVTVSMSPEVNQEQAQVIKDWLCTNKYPGQYRFSSVSVEQGWELSAESIPGHCNEHGGLLLFSAITDTLSSSASGHGEMTLEWSGHGPPVLSHTATTSDEDAKLIAPLLPLAEHTPFSLGADGASPYQKGLVTIEGDPTQGRPVFQDILNSALEFDYAALTIDGHGLTVVAATPELVTDPAALQLEQQGQACGIPVTIVSPLSQEVQQFADQLLAAPSTVGLDYCKHGCDSITGVRVGDMTQLEPLLTLLASHDAQLAPRYIRDADGHEVMRINLPAPAQPGAIVETYQRTIPIFAAHGDLARVQLAIGSDLNGNHQAALDIYPQDNASPDQLDDLRRTLQALRDAPELTYIALHPASQSIDIIKDTDTGS